MRLEPNPLCCAFSIDYFMLEAREMKLKNTFVWTALVHITLNSFALIRDSIEHRQGRKRLNKDVNLKLKKHY